MQINISNKAVFTLFLTIVVLVVGIIVIAAPDNGHDAGQIDFGEGIAKLRLADTGGNGVFWDIQEVAPSNDLTFKYTDEKVRITAMGHVGIGITPQAVLHVNGGTQQADTIFQVNQKIKMTGDGVYNFGAQANQGLISWDTGKVIVGARAGNDLTLYADGKEKMRVSQSGKVGIGTNPSYRFHVLTSDGSNFASRIENNHGEGRGLLVSASAGGTSAVLQVQRQDSSKRLFVVRGNGQIMLEGSNMIHSSDFRLKKNILTLDNSLEKVNKLEGVTFEWKEGMKGTQYGLIAQDVEKVYPDLVYTDEEGIKHLSYNHLIPILLESIKELSARVEQLEND